MSTKSTIIRAWKDKTFRASLSEEERQSLPSHPSGLIKLPDHSLKGVTGGSTWWSLQCTQVSACSFCGGPTYRGDGSNCAF